MTVPFDFRRGARREPVLPRSDAASSGERQASLSFDWRNAAANGEPPRRRVQGAPFHGEQDRVDGAGQTGEPVAGATTPPPRHEWNRREDLSSVERLAAVLETRQLERDRRRHEEVPVEPVVDVPLESGQAESQDELGERFGWHDRWSGDDVRDYLEDHEEPAARRWISPLVRVGAVLGVSAAVAYFVVFPGGAPDEAVERSAAVEQPAAADEAAEDQVVSRSDGASAPAATSEEAVQTSTIAENRTPVMAGASAGERSTFAPRVVADSPPSAVPSADTDDVRMIMPAPHQITVGEGGAQAAAPAPAQPDQTEAGQAGPVLQSREAGPSWIAPSPAAREQAEPVDPVASAELTEASGSEVTAPTETASTASASSSGVTVAVNMRAEPDNDGAVLAVIPANATVDLIGCDIWCEVVYEGQQGWVFRNFVAGAE